LASGAESGGAVTFVGRVPRSELEGGQMVRLAYPPFDVLVAIVNGAPCAMEDACNHAGASLTEGDRQGDCVACPMHGYVFDITTGRLLRPRALCDDQRTFVARFEGDDVVVWDPGAGVTIVGP
jgi:nitrite reductase/ring-hydroxylating ferredoxin subunit